MSLHDVSPRTREASSIILEALADQGVPHCSLLVIPDHHQRGHFLADADFCAWLRDQAKRGHEIVIHGYFHQRRRREGESARTKFTTRLYTADEGEFHDLDRESARTLVLKAREECEKLGLAPTGFIAPAWLLNREAEDVLRELGVKYTTRLGSVLDLQTGTTHRSQSLVWSVRSGWRRQMSLAWNAFLFRRLESRGLLRISIHPVDLDHATIWKQIRALVARALADREAVTYDAWLRRQT